MMQEQSEKVQDQNKNIEKSQLNSKPVLNSMEDFYKFSISSDFNKSRSKNKAKIDRKTLRSTKSIGLKNLTELCVEILEMVNSGLQYKSVAEILMGILYPKEKHYFQNQKELQERQHSNITRRVYDALNVLVAVGILKKEGKNLSLKQKIKSTKFYKKQLFKQKKKKLEEGKNVSEQKKKKLFEPHQTLLEKEEKLQTLKNLLNSAKLFHQKNQHFQQNQQMSEKVIQVTKQNYIMALQMAPVEMSDFQYLSKGKDKLQITEKFYHIKYYGDAELMDLVVKPTDND